MKFNKNILIPCLALALFLAWPLTMSLAQTQTPAAGFFDKYESLRDQMWAKKMELKVLQQAGNVQEARTVIAEMTKLKSQMRNERRQLAGPEAEARGWGKGQGPGAGWGPGECPWGYGPGGPGKGKGKHWGRHCWN